MQPVDTTVREPCRSIESYGRTGTSRGRAIKEARKRKGKSMGEEAECKLKDEFQEVYRCLRGDYLIVIRVHFLLEIFGKVWASYFVVYFVFFCFFS